MVLPLFCRCSTISIHALREESDIWQMKDFTNSIISIHALREESDGSPSIQRCLQRYFNPRPPRGERQFSVESYVNKLLFQSTPSARRATRKVRRRERRILISIHALREEGD